MVKVGDQAKRDQPLLEILTDKVDSEVPSPSDVFVKEILLKEGQTVPVKSVIAVPSSDQLSAGNARALGITGAKSARSLRTSDEMAKSSSSNGTGSTDSDGLSVEGATFLSPVVREVLREHGIPER